MIDMVVFRGGGILFCGILSMEFFTRSQDIMYSNTLLVRHCLLLCFSKRCSNITVGDVCCVLSSYMCHLEIALFSIWIDSPTPPFQTLPDPHCPTYERPILDFGPEIAENAWNTQNQ